MLPKGNARPKSRKAVPDCLLFALPRTKAATLTTTKDNRRYRIQDKVLQCLSLLSPAP